LPLLACKRSEPLTSGAKLRLPAKRPLSTISTNLVPSNKRDKSEATGSSTGASNEDTHPSDYDRVAHDKPFGKAVEQSASSHNDPIDLTHVDDTPPRIGHRPVARSRSPLSLTSRVEAETGTMKLSQHHAHVERFEKVDEKDKIAIPVERMSGDVEFGPAVGGEDKMTGSKRRRGERMLAANQVSPSTPAIGLLPHTVQLPTFSLSVCRQKPRPRPSHTVLITPQSIINSGKYTEFHGKEACFNCRLHRRQCLVAEGAKKCGSRGAECTFRPSNDSSEQITRCTTIWGTLELLHDHVEEGSKQAKRLEESMRLISQIALRFGPIKVMGTPVLPDEL
jgi:hypothetical protein